MKDKDLRNCSRCIMDNVNDPDLFFDSEGICNHCMKYERAAANLPIEPEREQIFKTLIKKLIKDGKGKPYDAIIGVSGGVDSTYLSYVAYTQGLRLLLVHCDNGWNTETSVNNIENIIKRTNFNLHTVVLNWEEFRDIQISFLKAGVVDIELPYDYALIVSMYKIAKKYGIHNILSGHNLVTEGTYMPKSWVHYKMDILNIKAIHRQFGKIPMKTFPHFSPWTYSYYEVTKYFNRIALLNYIDYNKQEAKEIIIRELNWRDYGGKHYESVFTRFYQGYILPNKFHIDKRQFHLSALIWSGQISRRDALLELNKPTYLNESLFLEDFEYVKKKLGFTDATWSNYMNAPVHKHWEYGNITSYWNRYYKVIKFLKPLNILLGIKGKV